MKALLYAGLLITLFGLALPSLLSSDPAAAARVAAVPLTTPSQRLRTVSFKTPAHHQALAEPIEGHAIDTRVNEYNWASLTSGTPMELQDPNGDPLRVTLREVRHDEGVTIYHVTSAGQPGTVTQRGAYFYALLHSARDSYSIAGGPRDSQWTSQRVLSEINVVEQDARRRTR